MDRSNDLKAGDYIEINFIRGTQLAVFSRYGGKKASGNRTVFIRRWLDSKGEFGPTVVSISEAAVVGKAKPGDARLARARAVSAAAKEQPWK